MPQMKQKGAWVWPVIVVVLLGCHAAGTLMLVMWTRADVNGGSSVVPHAYDKGLKWDETQGQTRAEGK